MQSISRKIRLMLDQGNFRAAEPEILLEPLSAVKFLVLAEISLWKNQIATAAELLAGAGAALILEDADAEFHFWLNLNRAHLARLQRKFGESLNTLDQLPKPPTGTQGEAYVRWNRALCLAAAGEIEKALAEFETALKTADRGFQAYPRILLSHGLLQKELGHLQDAERLIDQASRGYARLGLMHEHGVSLVELAVIARLRKEWDRVDDLLDEAISLCRTHSDLPGESQALLLLSETYLDRQKLPQAEEKLAAAQLRMAETNDAVLLCTLKLLEIRLHTARRQNVLAAQRLIPTLELARANGLTSLETQLYLYGAECCRQIEPATAGGYLETARARITENSPGWLQEELERISQPFGKRNSISTMDGVLTVITTPDVPNGLFPTWAEGVEAMHRFLLTEALKRTEGSLTRAAGMLKISVGHVSQRCKDLDIS